MARKLLLADDSITIQKVVELVLAEEGFEIKAVNNGEEALAIVGQFRPDIVLADIDMPKMNGYQLCDKIKADPATRAIPVLLLAGAFEPLDEELAKNVGAEDYIIKPFESQELISKINSAIAVEEMEMGAPVEEEAAVEAVEGVLGEEDLWAMEEDLPSEAVAVEGLGEEGPLDLAETPLEELATLEGFAFSEGDEAEARVDSVIAEEAADRTVAGKPAIAAPLPDLLTAEKAAELFKRSVDEKISAALSSIDMKGIVVASLAPTLKDSTEKVLWEVAPELMEKLLKEMLQGSLATIVKEVEKVIWETVPDLAESMISREIERIKSEL
jgi:CheY-like chemotaxis protein